MPVWVLTRIAYIFLSAEYSSLVVGAVSIDRNDQNATGYMCTHLLYRQNLLLDDGNAHAGCDDDGWQQQQ